MSDTEWEEISGDTERLDVPGGWIYRAKTGATVSLVYVPYAIERTECPECEERGMGPWHLVELEEGGAVEHRSCIYCELTEERV